MPNEQLILLLKFVDWVEVNLALFILDFDFSRRRSHEAIPIIWKIHIDKPT